MNKLIYPFVLFFSCLIISCAVSNTKASAELYSTQHYDSNSRLDKILSEGIIRVGTTGDYTPFSYQLNSNPNNYNGIDITMAKNLAKSLDVDIQFVKTTWPTLMEDLKANKFDIGMSGITITLSRQKTAFFSTPVTSDGKVAIARDEDVDKFKTIDAINKSGIRVIVNPGGTNEVFAKANFPLATIIINEDNISIFQNIVDGKADIMVTDRVETKVQELIHPELQSVNPDKPFNFSEKGYLIPRDLILKEFVDQWLNLRKKDGTVERIFNQELSEIKKRSLVRD